MAQSALAKLKGSNGFIAVSGGIVCQRMLGHQRVMGASPDPHRTLTGDNICASDETSSLSIAIGR